MVQIITEVPVRDHTPLQEGLRHNPQVPCR